MNDFCYKGQNKSSDYFEGWYLKLVDTKQSLSYVIIWGITLYEKDPHAFIQIINGQTNKSDYLRFPVNDFTYGYKSISIKDNVFTPYEIKLKTKHLTIDLKMSEHELLDTNQLVPGTMGFFKYLPLCTNHEIIYLQANAKGKIIDNKQKYDFDGLSYMEKNWGNQFQKQWLWAQTNHFNTSHVQLVIIYTKLSIMDIPIFFCVLKIKGVEYRFASYNGSRINILTMTNDHTILNITRGCLKLHLKINDNHNEMPLIAPVKNGRMLKVIGQSLTSTLSLSLYENNTCIFKDDATNVHYENIFINY